MKLCWNVTNVCNAKCIHCFRNLESSALDINQNLKILKNLVGSVRHISFSGGEVLLYKDFETLLKSAKELGFGCSMTTNAILLNTSNLDKYIQYLDRITFSLDYIDDEKNYEFGRGENYCSHLKEIISAIKERYPDFIVKVNTVITKENFKEIDNIYRTLKSLKINSWKLMRFCPYRSIAKENAKRLCITDAKFDEIRARSQLYSDINVTVEDISEIEDQIFISPSGDLCVGKNNEDVVLLGGLHNQTKENVKAVLQRSELDTDFLDLNLNLYKSFYFVAKEGNISSAAKKMFVSQPAISKAIKKVEQELNVSLFNRSINGMTLTQEGEKFLEYIETVFNYIKTAKQSIKELHSFDRGNLRIGTPSHIGTFLIFNHVNAFRQKFPSVKVSIVSRSTRELAELLREHELDFLIDITPQDVDTEGLKVLPLLQAKHCFVCKKSNVDMYSGVESIFDLQDKPLILPVPHSSHRKNLNYICDMAGVKFSNVLSIETSEMLVNAVCQGLGIGYVLYDVVEDKIKNGELVEIEVKEKLPKVEISLMYFDKFLTKVPEHFIKEYLLSNNQKL